MEDLLGVSLPFLDTGAAIAALQAKLTALRFTIGGAPIPAFQKVAPFDMSNLLVALRELLTYGDRVCIIIHDVEHFVSEKCGNELHVRQTREVTLLIADRHYADRQKAMFGDVATPGAVPLKDLVLNSIIGLLVPGIYIEPVRGEQMVLEQKTRDELQGRVAFTLAIRLVGGNTIVGLGRQPIP